MTAIPFAISSRHKGFNRAEVVDQNFIEFVQLWQGDVRAAPRDSEAVLPGDTPKTLSARVLVEEHRIYPEALRMLASGQSSTQVPVNSRLDSCVHHDPITRSR